MSRRDEDMIRGDAVDQATAWCLRLAEGRLATQTRAAFDGWLAADPEHARAFDDAVRVWQALEQTHRSPELIEMRRGALDSFRRGHAQRWNRGSERRRWLPVAAAAGLVFMALGAWSWMRFVPERYETRPGERRVIALEDGSNISLDARSRVDVRYSGDRRELWLREGRARFQVARDSLRPFSVRAADKVVVATGTQFSVELLSSQVHVILYQGSVDVLATQGGALQPVQWKPEPAASAAAGMRQSLPPSRELVVGKAASAATLRPADPVRSLSWEAGQLVFNEEPLALAVERMNRYIDRPLSVGDPAVGHIRISGTFLAGDIDAFLEGVTGIFPVRIDTSAGREVLVLAR